MTTNASPPGLDPARLLAYLVADGILDRGAELEVHLLASGRSNLTYTLDSGDEHLIVRRPPLAHVLETAHDMGREYKVLSALEGTGVPVPRTRCYCDDPEVIGRPFYVMERVEGAICRREEDLLALPLPQRHEVGIGILDTLAALHRVDPDAVGLGAFGRPEGFMERQLRRWSQQLASSTSRELQGSERLIAGLGARLPAPQGAAIVHGDYRLDNIILTGSTVRAVLDWEMSTLGDPLSDLGLCCLYWDGLPEDTDLLAAMFGRVEGAPRREELLGRYERATGFDLVRFNWYLAFAAFKLAVIIEGIYYRGLISTDPHGETNELGAYVEPLIACGLRSLATDGGAN